MRGELSGGERKRHGRLGWLAALVLAGVAVLGGPARGEEGGELLEAWFERQGEIKTWRAVFVQTRQLQALAQPLVTRGRVWFAAPHYFRWELGEPAQTVAVRQEERMLVLYPRLRRAEIYPVTEGGGGAGGPWREALLLLEAGFPTDRKGMEARFEVMGLEREGEVAAVALRPRSAEARRLISRFTLGFSTVDYALRWTSLQFADGSELRNVFSEAEVNPPLDRELFEFEPGPEYRQTRPLR
jgi:outer membrane lipoprotein-sorting protein